MYMCVCVCGVCKRARKSMYAAVLCDINGSVNYYSLPITFLNTDLFHILAINLLYSCINFFCKCIFLSLKIVKTEKFTF